MLQGPAAARQLKLSCMPNPATDRVQLRIEGLPAPGGRLSVADINGRQVYAQALQAVSVLPLNVADWAPGLYILTLTSAGKRVSERLVVQ